MLDNRLAQEIGENFEKRIGGIFKKYGLGVSKLDRDKTIQKPDYLVNKGAKKFVCECKFIASAGTLDSGRYHISTLDPELATRNKGAFTSDGVRKTREVLVSARNQFLSLCKSEPNYNFLPFVVALKSDFFAAGFYFVPSDIFGLTEISAVMTLESNTEIKAALHDLPLEELEEVIGGMRKIKLPQTTLRFKVLVNKGCNVKFKPVEFLKNPIII
jgi:hypothetical protein